MSSCVYLYFFELILPQLVIGHIPLEYSCPDAVFNLKNMTGHLIWVVTETDYWYCVIKSERGRSNVFGF